jgi:hypothetical protein
MDRIRIADLIVVEVWSKTHYNMLNQACTLGEDLDIWNKIFSLFPKTSMPLEISQKVWDIKDEQK